MIFDLDPLFLAIGYDVEALLEAACDAQGEFPAACALVVVAEHIRGLLDQLWDWHEAAMPLARAALGTPEQLALFGQGRPG
jgi:hypothetical protein